MTPDPIESKDEKYDFDPEDTLKPEPTNVDDPFGNEANAEVKYKTLKWWYVVFDLRRLSTGTDHATGNAECVCGDRPKYEIVLD